MDLPLVNQREQRRPLLKAKAITHLVEESEGEVQALYVLLAATGMRISETLALETRHITNDGRTIEVRQQVERDTPRIIICLKTNVVIEMSTCTRTLRSSCNVILAANPVYCSLLGMARHTCITTSRIAG
jgi:site-specific recombinase XerD